MQLTYTDFKRFQKFWVDLFGWDMFELPVAVGGKTPGSDSPSVLIATGPSYETWEAVVPGHMNAMAHHRPDVVEPASFMLEIHMDQPITATAAAVATYGGTPGEVPDEKDGWDEGSMLAIKDPSGNELSLWKCPSSRTWDEAEAGYDKD
jgi:predicted enzyme related to lactoylglutathione lyase